MQVHSSRVLNCLNVASPECSGPCWIVEPAIEDYTIYILDGYSIVMQFQQLHPRLWTIGV